MAASPMSSSTRPGTRATGDVGVHSSVFVLTRKLAPIAYTWGSCLFDMKRFEEALKMFEYAMGIGMRAEAVLLKWWVLFTNISHSCTRTEFRSLTLDRNVAVAAAVH